MARIDMQNRGEWQRIAEASGYRAAVLATLLEVSYRQLQRYTRTAFGRSPQGWLDDERLMMAPALLKSQRSVKVVAFGLGFKQPSHFTRVFKRRYGMCPKEFVAANVRGGLLEGNVRHG